MAIELVSYTDLERLLDLGGGVISEYPALAVIRDGVVSAIEEYLGRSLEKIEYTETSFQGNVPSKMIKLDAIPVASVSSVTLTYAGDDTVLTSNDYEITGYGLRLYAKVQNCKIVVVYTGGWESADVPAAVSRAALLQTAYEFQSKEQIGAESVSTEGGSVSRPALGLIKEVKRMLNRYKHPLMEI